MRIHSLTIDNVRAIEHLEITGLPDTGVVVVHGDNEQGKSTIMDALGAVLNHKHSSSKGEVKQLAPAHRDEAPEVTAHLSVGPVDFTIHKRWVKKKSAELTVHAPVRANYTGAEADLKLEEILAEHLDRDLLEALFLRQGKFEEGIKTAGIPSLQRALAGEQGEEAVDAAEDDSLMAAVEKEYQRFYTATGKENKALSNSRRDRDTAATELAAAQQQLRSLQSHVDQVDRHEQSRDADVADLPAARAQLAAAEAELVSAREAESAAAVVRGEVDHARQVVVSEERQVAERAQLEEEAEDLADALTALSTQLDRATEKAAQQEQEMTRLGQVLKAAKERRSDAVDRVKSARRVLRLLEDVAARDEHRAEVEQLGTLDENIASVRTRAAGKLVTDQDMREVEQAAQEVAVARRFRDMAVPHLELSSADSTTITLDGTPLVVGAESTRVDLSEGTELIVGEVTARYRAGQADDVSAINAVERAESELADLLAELGCTDLEEVRRLREEARSVRDNLARLEQQRADLLGGRSAEDVRARAASLTEQLEDTEIPDIDVESARAELDQAEVARDEADQDVDKAESAYATWRDSDASQDLVRIQAHHDNASERVTRTAEKLATLEAELPAADLASALASARDTLAAAEEKLRGAEADVAQADPAGKSAAVDATRSRVESLTSRIKTAEVELARLDGYITQAAGAAERLEKAQSADEAMRRQLANLERRANSAARLREVLYRHRDRARARYAQPFADELTRLARTVFGSDVAFELSENLTIRDRTLGGATVPLASLSGGAREQLAILTRFAIASLVSGSDEKVGVPVIIDDALGSTDPGRLQRMGQLFSQMGREAQVIVLTCFPQRYDWVHPKTEYPITQLKTSP